MRMVGSLLKLATPTIAPPPNVWLPPAELCPKRLLPLDEPGGPVCPLTLLAKGLIPKLLPGCEPTVPVALPPKLPPLPSDPGPFVYCAPPVGLPAKLPPLPSELGPLTYCAG